MTKKIYGYLLIITLLVTGSPLISFSQAIETPGNFLQINISPEKPQPLQDVQISLQSFSYDLDRSAITWSVNGQNKKTEVGAKTFNTTAGKNGVKTTIGASVVTPNDGTKTISISFTPAEVDLIYESLSYTPPFYKGKALNPKQGIVRVTAIPNLISGGLKVSTKNIVYTWKKDNYVQGSASGLGKNTFTFTGEIPIRDARIEVEVSSLDNSVSASNQINITNVDPKIIFYENSPIYGVLYNRAILNTVQMITDEFSVVAVPYSFNINSSIASSSLKYTWSLNGKNVSNQDPENSFTTKILESGSGTANIGLEVKNIDNIFQKSTNNYSVNFTKR